MLFGDFLLQQHEQYWRHLPRSNSNIYMLLKQDNTHSHTHSLSLLSLDCVGPRNWCCSTSRPASLYHHKPFCAATPSPREGPSLSITHSHSRQHDQALPESQSEWLLSFLSLFLSAGLEAFQDSIWNTEERRTLEWEHTHSSWTWCCQFALKYFSVYCCVCLQTTCIQLEKEKKSNFYICVLMYN